MQHVEERGGDDAHDTHALRDVPYAGPMPTVGDGERECARVPDLEWLHSHCRTAPSAKARALTLVPNCIPNSALPLP